MLGIDDRIVNFHRFVIRLRKRQNYAMNCIGNVDQTPVWLEMPGKYKLVDKGAKTVSMTIKSAVGQS